MPSVNILLEKILTAASSGGATLWGGITGNIIDQTDLAEVAKTNDYDDLINKPDLSDNFSGGFMVYNDLATAGTPLVHIGGIDTPLTNDELGSQTLKTFMPNGVTDVWNASLNMFDFSELSNGDMIDMRIDINVTTTSPDQEIFINLELGQGGSPFTVPFAHDIYKSTGAKPVGSYKGLYMGDDNIRLNGGQFIFSSTDNATIIVNGWYVKIIKRG